MTVGTVAKQELLAILEDLPDEVDLEELFYRVYLREKLAAADRDIAEGRTISQEEMRARVASWHT